MVFQPVPLTLAGFAGALGLAAFPIARQLRAESALWFGTVLTQGGYGPGWNQDITDSDRSKFLAAVVYMVAGRLYRNPTFTVEQSIGTARQKLLDEQAKWELTDAEEALLAQVKNRDRIPGLGTLPATRGDLVGPADVLPHPGRSAQVTPEDWPPSGSGGYVPMTGFH